MARLTREQSQALTRAKLLDAAYAILARDGYSGVKVERVAEEAGFSKGAFYSNFTSKEDIFLQLLDRNAGSDVVELSELLESYDEPEALINALSAWVNKRASDQRWGTLAIELLHMARQNETLSERHLKMFREQWEGVGRILIRKLFPSGGPPASPFYIGGVVLELTYGGISSFLDRKGPGEMVKLVLTSMYLAHRVNQAAPGGRRRKAERQIASR